MGDEAVLERILNGDEDPKDLPLALLKQITNDFSEDRNIGQGGFGAVYKGVLQNGIIVAVKRMYVNEHTVNDVSFRREFNSLVNTNHQNVVRFLGFCSNTHKISIKEAGSGKNNLVNINERLLCLEYISNGSLDKHITDELRGLEWETRYDIITGICKGLCYLHEEKQIIHMDLKPANILLDDQMVPKITDFGLSRPNENSHTMGQRFGTRGYFAPEYETFGKTAFECDIYSLGAIIIELVTGCMCDPDKNNVLRRWRHRWSKPPTLLQDQQVTRCINIAVRCRQQEPKDRPAIGDIINFLSESESSDGHTGQESTYLDDGMLGIEPLELHFTFKLNKEISCSVKLINKTRACFAFNIERPSQQYIIRPEKGIVRPECNERLVQITVQPQERAPQVTQNADKFIVQSMKVSEGLRNEDITENIFRAEAGKVVDEVDLMVVYDTSSRKRGQDPNVPVKAVSRKPKVINPISYEDGARGQRDRRNFHPPENFSRGQPTNDTYLPRVSDRAVDVTRGAMGSLLHKLGELCKEEFNLETSVKEDVESLSEELMEMQSVLRKVSEVQQDNLDDLVKRWAIHVREMSYGLEDFVDGFLVCSEPTVDMGGFRKLTHERHFLLDKDNSHQPIGDLIKHHISKKVQDAAKKRKQYKVDTVVPNAPAKAATITDTSDPRRFVVFQHSKQLVGIEEPRDNLIKRLSQVSEKQLRILSIYGAGGSGKTTLAKALYDKLEGPFHPMAFVSVGRNPDEKQVLKNILRRIEKDSHAENLDVWELIEKLKQLLVDKRYFMVVDDIWDSSAWGIIKQAFPEENKHGSRVVITTRIHSVAVDCCNASRKYVYEMETLNDRDSRRLFVSRIFDMEDACPDVPEDILTVILKKCGGLPLAIISIASLVAKKDPRRRSTWDYVRKSLIAMFEGDNPTRIDMEKILDLSYRHLPNYLKTCLLSVGKYREDHEIEKDELLRQWIAEGFVVSTTHGLDAEDVAKHYFDELIDMSMIQPVKRDYNNEVLSCRVHDIMLDLIRSKAAEENFIHVVDGLKYVTKAHGEIHRVSVHHNGKEDRRISERINKGSLSHVRSVLFSWSSVVPHFLESKFIRVLHIEHCNFSSYSFDLTGISRLFLLRYLKVACGFGIKLKLPNQIGQLQQLETIDIYVVELINFPSDIVSLPWLSHLRLRRLVLPDGIDRLKSLRTLEGVDVFRSSVENIKGLSKLTNLRKLHICWNGNREFVGESLESTRKALYSNGSVWVEETTMNALYSSICKLSANLRTFTSRGIWVYIPDVPGWITRTPFPRGSHIQELNLLGCRFQRCPKWIGQLDNLYKFSICVREVADGVSIVAGLGKLAFFELLIGLEEKEEESVVICSGEFKALKHLCFCCPKASLTFEPGAMPMLEKLDILFRYNMAPQFLPVGIQNLPVGTLKQIWLGVSDEWHKVCDMGDDGLMDYLCSKEYRDKSRKQRELGPMLKGAFKEHHPGANIVFYVGGIEGQRIVDEDYEEDDSEEDNEEDDDEEDYSNEEDDEEDNEEDDNEEDNEEDDDEEDEATSTDNS